MKIIAKIWKTIFMENFIFFRIFILKNEFSRNMVWERTRIEKERN